MIPAIAGKNTSWTKPLFPLSFPSLRQPMQTLPRRKTTGSIARNQNILYFGPIWIQPKMIYRSCFSATAIHLHHVMQTIAQWIWHLSHSNHKIHMSKKYIHAKYPCSRVTKPLRLRALGKNSIMNWSLPTIGLID